VSSAYDAIAGEPRSAERGLTNRFAGEKETYSFIVTEEGTTNLWTPSAGKQITLWWVALNSSQNNTEEVLAVVKLPPWEPYAWYMGNPGAFMHWEPIVGSVGAELSLELQGAGQSVIINFTLTEDFPRNE
jgi:hypothetical protein